MTSRFTEGGTALIKSKKASFIFKLCIAVIGTFVLCDSAGVFRMNFRVSFLYYFTNISNLLLVAYFWGALFQAYKHPETAQKPWMPTVKHTLMLGITVTGLVAYFLLDHGEVFVNGVFKFNNFILHDVTPICAVLDWLLFDEKPTMSFKEPLIWPLYPLTYFAYIIVLVLGFGVQIKEKSRWPYGFMDFDKLGVPTVALTIVILIVVFVALGYLYVVIDKKLGEKIKKAKN